jgi:uncharacterized protein (UPF0332 family)
VTEAERLLELTRYWIRKSKDALDSSRAELRPGRLDFATNRAYYARFYAASAVLLKMGKKFAKHSGPRGAAQRDLAKAGFIDPGWDRVFDRIFENRQSPDYAELWSFEHEQVEQMIEETAGFVRQMERLLNEATRGQTPLHATENPAPRSPDHQGRLANESARSRR